MGTQGDLSDRFVSGTIRHLEKVAGGAFNEGILSQTGFSGNTLFYKGAHIIVRDAISEIILDVELPEGIDIRICNGTKGYFGLKDKHKSYLEIVTDYEVKQTTRGFNVKLQIANEANSSGRTNNWDKLFFGVYHCAMHPILRLIEEQIRD